MRKPGKERPDNEDHHHQSSPINAILDNPSVCIHQSICRWGAYPIPVSSKRVVEAWNIVLAPTDNPVVAGEDPGHRSQKDCISTHEREENG